MVVRQSYCLPSSSKAVVTDFVSEKWYTECVVLVEENIPTTPNTVTNCFSVACKPLCTRASKCKEISITEEATSRVQNREET